MTNSGGVGEIGAAYAGVRERIVALVQAADRETLGRTVPACPDWRVRDLISHVAGVVDDVLGGRLGGAGTDPWTAAQVESRRETPTSDVLAEWNSQAPQLEAILDSFGPAGHQAVMDAVTHEHDLRGALGAAGERDTAAVRIGVGWLMEVAVGAAAAAGHPPLRIRTPDAQDWSWGGEPVATLTAEHFELLRAFSGRRAVEEIRELAWEGDVDAALASFTFGPFTPRATPLGE